MTVSYGTKAQQRRSVLSLWVPYRPTKPVAFSGETDQSPSDSPGSDSPTSDPSSTSVTGKGFLRTRLTRSGSKLLSLLGLGSPSSGKPICHATLRQSAHDGFQETRRAPSPDHTETITATRVAGARLFQAQSKALLILPMIVMEKTDRLIVLSKSSHRVRTACTARRKQGK